MSRPERFELQTVVETQAFIAEGGMAKVHRAHDERLDRVVAMKSLDQSAPAVVRVSFEREAKLMARLDHPGIVGVYGLSGPADPFGVFTMKLVEGRTLAEIIDDDGPPRGRELALILRAVLRICETLAYAHDRGVIHRDLKPANIMLGNYGECYVMDWGVAYERDSSDALLLLLEPPGAIIGTPAFMAPEQALGRTQDIDPRTDVFGVGAILFYVLTGRAPYGGSSLSIVLDQAREGRVADPEIVSRGGSIPARLSDIVSKALALRREDRFQTAMELHAALEQFLYTGDWFSRRRVGNGELIVREGERGDRAYIVESGECEAFRATEHGEVPLRRIGPGEVIGELALFSSGKRTASIRAITPMTLLEVTRDALEQELPTGSWTRQVVNTVVQRFLSMDQAQASMPSGRRPEPKPVREPEPELEPEPSPTSEPSPMYWAKVAGVTLALTIAGLLLLKLAASLLG
jgi:tRNA A-37 threonylcarbamoyl transferase component Bud32